MGIKKTVMLVDDEESILFSLQRILELSGEFDVLKFQSGVEALKKTRDFIPDLIISDIAMPEMNGIDLCKKIRQSELTKNIPFLFLTAKKEMMIDGIKAGGDDFILKPFTFDEVLVKIEAIFRRVDNTKEQVSQFKGKLEENGLDKILQICHEKSISGEILLQFEDESGRIKLERGEIISIAYKDMAENEALDILRGWDSGIFVVRPIGVKLKAEFFSTDTITQKSGNVNDVVEISKEVYWVGNRNAESSLLGNVYLRRFKKDNKAINLVIDPGSPLDFPVISRKIAKIINNLANVHLFSLNHQDPDICMNSVFIRNANANSICLTTEDSWRYISHYEIEPNSVKLIDSFKNNKVKLATGHQLKFRLAPFCRARGSFLIYDIESRILFSGDLFGGFLNPERKNDLFASEEDWDGVREFHQIYMPSQSAIRKAIESIKALNPPPLMIAPQHGNVLRGKIMERFLDRIYYLDVGSDFIDRDPDSENVKEYFDAARELLEYGNSFIEMGKFDEKLKANAQLSALCKISNGKIEKIINRPKVVYEQIALAMIDGENMHLINQIKSMALKISRSKGLPIPALGWEDDRTISGVPTQIFDEEE